MPEPRHADLEPPRRLVEGPEGEELSSLLRGLRTEHLTTFDLDAALARFERQLDASTDPGPEGGGQGAGGPGAATARSGASVLTGPGALALGSAGVLAAATLGLVWWLWPASPEDAVVDPIAETEPSPAPALAEEERPGIDAASEVLQAPGSATTHAPEPSSGPAVAPSDPDPELAPPSTATGEATAPVPRSGRGDTASRGARSGAATEGPGEIELAQSMRRALDAGDARGALRLAREGQKRFPGGLFDQERRAHEVFALAILGRDAEARRRAAAFLRRYPSGPLADRVRDVLDGEDR